MVRECRMTLVEAAKLLGVSYRHAKRLKKAAVAGIGGLVHGNQGKQPANKVDEAVRERVVALLEGRYSGFNDTHFAEMLAEREGITLSRETIRRIRKAAGMRPKRKRRVRQHHRRRPRKAAEGTMMLWDGSPHRWFGKKYDPCCLMAAMDDASGKVLALRFVDAESSWAYLSVLERVVCHHGIPASVYQDRHGALKRNDDFWSISEQLAGRQDPTQVGAALEALGIQAIYALTPQAKGRVERLFGTLQDRLVAMLEIEGITEIEAANEYVETRFLDYFNNRFSIAAEEATSVWRKAPKGLDMERILSLQYTATVANDNAVRLSGMVIDVPPGAGGRSYAGVRAEVRQMLDGSWRVYYQDKLIAQAPATELAEPIRTRSRRKGIPAGHDTQWVYMASAPARLGRAPAADADTMGSIPASKAAGTARRAGPGRSIGATRIA
jgi:transposase